MVIFFSQLSSTHPIPRRSSSCRSIIALFIQSEVHRKQDLVKLFQHEGKVLRFKAKFAKPKPEVSPQKSAAFLTHWNQWIRHLLNFSDGCITWWLPSPIIWKYNLQSPHKWSQRCVKSPNFFRCLRCFFFGGKDGCCSGGPRTQIACLSCPSTCRTQHADSLWINWTEERGKLQQCHGQESDDRFWWSSIHRILMDFVCPL